MAQKVEVSKKLLEQIIDCYVNKQYSLEKTIKILNLPFGRNPLKRILRENGIHIRTFKEAANSSPKIVMTPELTEQIIDLYDKGYSIEKIQKALIDFYSSDRIKKVLVDNNIKLRTLEEAKQTQINIEERKYIVNDNYCFESHNGAWLLGFYAADGYMPNTKGAKNRITIGLARKDEEVLYLIAKEIGYNGPIYQYISNKHESSSLAFTSKKLREKFEFYGVVNNKTFKIHNLPKDLPQEYMMDYIRGYFDGDGSIFKPKDKRIGMNITCANKDFLEDVQDFLYNNYNIKSYITRNHDAYQLKFGVEASLRLGELMYNNDYLALPRKKNRYFEIITPTSLNTPKE